MPLVKSSSPGAFRKNVKAEVESGKSVKQSVAIAYTTQRSSAKQSKGALRKNEHSTNK